MQSKSRCNKVFDRLAIIAYFLTLGSLSTRVFETRTATGSELISLLTCSHTTTFTLLSIFSPLRISSRKIWRTLRSKHAKCSLPVAVRVLKTCVLKLPIVYIVIKLKNQRVPHYCSSTSYRVPHVVGVKTRDINFQFLPKLISLDVIIVLFFFLFFFFFFFL